MRYRVMQEFTASGELPDQTGIERLQARLRASEPDSDPTVEVGIGRMCVVVTVQADDDAEAAAAAQALVGAVIGRAAVRVDVAMPPPV